MSMYCKSPIVFLSRLVKVLQGHPLINPTLKGSNTQSLDVLHRLGGR